MNYVVEWSEAALADLATFWLTAPDRNAVSRSEAEIDRLLRRDPHGNGIHRSEGIWRIDVFPLAATYSINNSTREVEVNGVHLLA